MPSKKNLNLSASSVCFTLTFFFALFLTSTTVGQTVNPQPIVTVSAADYRPDTVVAADSIVAGFGVNLATGAEKGEDTDPATPGIQLPKKLQGSRVLVNGVEADLFYVGPTQINYLVPKQTALGIAIIRVESQNGAFITNGTLQIGQVGPGIFTATQDGTGVPSAYVVRVKPDNSQINETISTFDTGTSRFLAKPIDLGPADEKVILILFLTGIRNAPDPNSDGNANESVRVLVNGNELVPAYSGVQPNFIGLDQINVELPRYLLGNSALDIQIKVNGILSNRSNIELVAPNLTNLSWRARGLAGRTIRNFASLGSYLFAATNEGVYRSSDNGANWILGGGLPNATQFLSLAVYSNIIYAGSEGGGVWVSYDSGTNWTAFNTGLAGLNLTINGLTFDGVTLYASTSGGVCRYNRTLNIWEALSAGLSGANSFINNFLVDAGNYYIATNGGVCRYNRTSNIWETFNGGLSAGTRILSLASANGVLYAGTFGGGLCRYNRTSSQWEPIITGLPATLTVSSIVIDGRRCFIGSRNGGVFVTNDGGATWQSVISGLTSPDLYALWLSGGAIFAGANQGGVFGAPLSSGNFLAYSQSVALDEDTSRGIILGGADFSLNPLTYTVLVNPSRGSLSGTAPNLVYTPNANYFGSDSFTFKVNNGAADSTFATVYLTIYPVNDAPVANNQAVTVNEDSQVNFTLTGSDVDNNSLTYTVTTAPTNGILTGTAPNLTYKPNANFNGTDSFKFRVSDGQLNSNEATVSIIVNQVNDAPVLTVPGAVNVSTGDPVNFVVSATDVDLGQTLTLSATNLPSGASFTAATGVFTWTPSVNGVFNVTFTATDNGSPALTDSKIVRISVGGTSANGFWKKLITATSGVTYDSMVLKGTKLFVATTTQKVLVSNDEGATFTPANTGFDASVSAVRNLFVIDNDLYACVNSSSSFKLFRSSNDGASWSNVSNTLSTNTPFTTMVKSGSAIMAFSLGGVYYRSVDNGATWTQLSNIRNGAGVLVTRAFTIGNRIYSQWTVFSQGGTLVVSDDNGLTWRDVVQGLPTPLSLSDIVNFNGVVYGLVSNSTGGGIYILNSANSSWSKLSTLNASAGSSLLINGTTLYVAPKDGTAPAVASLDGGVTWIDLTTGDKPVSIKANINGSIFTAYNGMTVANSNGLFAIGTDSTGTQGVYSTNLPVITTNKAPVLSVTTAQSAVTGSNLNFTVTASDQDAGQTVVLAATGLPSGATFTPGTGVFSWTPNTPGTYNVIFTAVDNGTPVQGDSKIVTFTVTGAALIGNWSTSPTPPTNQVITALGISGTNLLAGTSQGVYLSTDNGVTWAAVNNGLAAARSTTSLSVVGTTIFASTSDGLYVSSNNGTSWTKSNGTLGPILEVISNGSGLLASNNSILYTSTDNGLNWSILRQLGLSGSSFAITSGSIVVSLGSTILGATSNPGMISRSTNGGASWTLTSFSAANDTAYTIAANGATAFLGTSTGMYRSTNGGQSWAKLANGLPANIAVQKLLVNNGMVFAVVINQTNNSGSIWFSADNGTSWKAMDAGMIPNGTAFSFILTAGNGNLYAATGGTVVYKSPLPALGGLNTAPVVTVPATQNISTGQTVSFQVTASDADAGQTVVLTASNLPLGASFIPSTGQFNWTPGVAGIFLVGFTATDSGSPALSTANTVTINVAPPAASPDGFWTAMVSPGGTQINSLGSAGSTLYAGSNIGLYRSTNNGASWSIVGGSGLPTASGQQATFIGAVGTALYLNGADRGLYRSTDNGVSWTKLTVGLELASSGFTTIVSNGTTLFLGEGAGLYRSTDNGASWARVYSPNGVNSIVAIGTNVYAALNSSGVVRSTNNGSSFTTVPGVIATTLATAAVGQNIFFGNTVGVYRSVDNGVSVTAVNTGLPANLTVNKLVAVGNTLFAATSSGLYFSNNLGGNWTAMGSGDSPITANFLVVTDRLFAATTANVWSSILPSITANTTPVITVPAAQNATTTTPLTFTVSGNDPNSGQTVTLSAAGLPSGATFTPATGQFSWTPNVPGTVVVSFTATDNGTPQMADTKTVTITSTGVSPNGNWANITEGLPSGPQSIVVLGTEVFVGTISHGVYKTSNGGQTWTASNTGIPATGIISLSEVNGALYAASNSALYYSNDGGASWVSISTGLGGTVNNVTQVGTKLLASTINGVYASSNSGASWVLSSMGLPTLTAQSSPSTRALLTVGTDVYVAGQPSGVHQVYKSSDNGATWTSFSSGLLAGFGFGTAVNALAVSGSSIYAATGGGVYVTTNGGASWTVAGGGLPTTNNNALALAFSGSNLFTGYFFNTPVYASTNSGTTWAAMSVGDNVSYVRGIVVVGNKIYCLASPTGTAIGIFVSPIPGT